MGKRSQRVIVPRPDRLRSLQGVRFGWVDWRLRSRGWLARLSPKDITVYLFLCLVADRRGVSYYRASRIGEDLGLDGPEVRRTLQRLVELDLVAFRPFNKGEVDGFHQVLSLPGSPPRTAIDGLVEGLVARLGRHDPEQGSR